MFSETLRSSNLKYLSFYLSNIMFHNYIDDTIIFAIHVIEVEIGMFQDVSIKYIFILIIIIQLEVMLILVSFY